GAFAAVLAAGYATASQPAAQPVQNPQNVLVIPGVNEFLPLSAAPEIVLGLLIGLVVHEGGHGLLCRVEDIDIDSMGLALFTIIPVGAFVEPDERSRALANRGSQMRMFAAGVTNNFAITAIAFVLLFGPLAGSITVVSGVPVGDALPGSAAAEAGIGHGDVITAVDGQPVANATEFERALAAADSREVTLQRRNAGPVTVNRTLMITRAVPGVVEGIDLAGDAPPHVLAVNGTAVGTEAAFERELSTRSVAQIETDRGTAVIRVGAYVARVTEGGPLAKSGAPTDGTALIVTGIDGRSVHSADSLATVLDDYEPGDTVAVTAYAGGKQRTYNVTLGQQEDGSALLGVVMRRGTSGITVDAVGVEPYPADGFLRILGGGDGLLGGLTDGSIFQQIRFVLVLPFMSAIDPTTSFNFAGFSGPVANFYEATGPLSVLGGWVLTLANVAFWTGWINLQLGLFNCIPTFPLDGGHLLRTSIESVVARVPIEDRQALTTAVTGAVTITMLAGLVVMIFGPQLLS
ncbi:MAG: site-2 protease family protein, partial [Haloarculaceae archaeon]